VGAQQDESEDNEGESAEEIVPEFESESRAISAGEDGKEIIVVKGRKAP